jgi:predicted RNA polymerase sigma factor
MRAPDCRSAARLLRTSRESATAAGIDYCNALRFVAQLARGGGRAGLRARRGPRAARRPALERYQSVHATHAELISRASDAAGAAGAYKRAIALTANAIERAELERRLRALR